jgi:hypothetical protein
MASELPPKIRDALNCVLLHVVQDSARDHYRHLDAFGLGFEVYEDVRDLIAYFGFDELEELDRNFRDWTFGLEETPFWPH